MSIPDNIVLTPSLTPKDGRFGSGPSKVRDAQVQAIANAQPKILGTSHRQAGVRDLVGTIRTGLLDFFAAPEGYEIVLGVGGSTAFWDAATFSLVEQQAAHLVMGEFSGKFAKATNAAPFLADSVITEIPAGTGASLQASAGSDIYAWAHNETSTGVMVPVQRIPGADPGALTVIDATSAAGGTTLQADQADVYYFAPQKNFGSDGGLWLALCSPAAIERIERIASSQRWVPDFLNLKIALENSRSNQTYNTPAVATLLSMADQVSWLNEQGGMAFADAHTRESSDAVYSWAQDHPLAQPYVQDPQYRSQVVCTIDFDDSVDAAGIAKVLRSQGIVDVEPYRKLGRNQLRIATFVNLEPEDVRTLTRAIDYIIEQAQ